MRYLILAIMLLTGSAVFAQLEEADSNKIYMVAQEMPLFPGCKEAIEAEEDRRKCSSQSMLQFVYDNISYPDSAQANDIEGTVVVRFVVEKDGSVSGGEVLKDIGGGCGEEALRVVRMMNELPQKWSPGKNEGKTIRTYVNLPVKYKLTRVDTDPDFVFIQGDSIWLKFDEPADFKGGTTAFEQYLAENLNYPASGVDSCKVGIVELNMLVRYDGSLKIVELTDYNNLGFDYWFETIKFVNNSFGQWQAPVFQGREVNGSHVFRIPFKPDAAQCTQKVTDFEKALQLSQEAIQSFENDQVEESIAKWTEALKLAPDYTEFLAMRGQAYLALEKNEEACADLWKVRNLLGVPWYDQVLYSLCF